MNVEINKEQRELISSKISLCLEFLKREVQPHIIDGDNVCVPIVDGLDLLISNSEVYIRKTSVKYLVIEIETSKKYYLERFANNKSKKYICDEVPEMAVVFLQNWDNVKKSLLDQVYAKNKVEEDLNNFVNNFHL